MAAAGTVLGRGLTGHASPWAQAGAARRRQWLGLGWGLRQDGLKKQGGSGGGAAHGGPGPWVSVRAPLAGASVLLPAGLLQSLV